MADLAIWRHSRAHTRQLVGQQAVFLKGASLRSVARRITRCRLAPFGDALYPPLMAEPRTNLPIETRATCDACVMARADWPRDALDPGPFDPKLKCCTFAPFIPNYTLAKLWDQPAMQVRIADAQRRAQLTPLGLIPLEETSTDFGRAEKDRCAFLNEQARCSIWSERPTVCRTYFCVSDRGAAGQAKWRKIEAEGNEAEWTKANEVLFELGFTQDEIESLTWAEWVDRKAEFFARVRSLA